MVDLVFFGIGDIVCFVDYYFIIDSEYCVVVFIVDDWYVESDEFFGWFLVLFLGVVDCFLFLMYFFFVVFLYVQMNCVCEECCVQVLVWLFV